jgi:hypothetical protein
VISAGPREAFQCRAPPVGRVDVITSPLPSTATQNRADAHETTDEPLSLGRLVTRQPAAPPAGEVENTTAEASVATHNRADGHDTEPNATVPSNGGRSIDTGADHDTLDATALADPSSNPISSAA